LSQFATYATNGTLNDIAVLFNVPAHAGLQPTEDYFLDVRIIAMSRTDNARMLISTRRKAAGYGAEGASSATRA
jgi:hypothetical protein